jgi:hypothetical protein
MSDFVQCVKRLFRPPNSGDTVFLGSCLMWACTAVSNDQVVIDELSLRLAPDELRLWSSPDPAIHAAPGTIRACLNLLSACLDRGAINRRTTSRHSIFGCARAAVRLAGPGNSDASATSQFTRSIP